MNRTAMPGCKTRTDTGEVSQRTARPLSLALVTETFPPEVNGVAMTLGRLCGGLTRRGHAVSVVRPRMPEDYRAGCPLTDGPREITRPGFQIPNYPLMRIGSPSTAHLAASWRAAPPDVVHVATEGPMGLSAIRAAASLRIPCTSSFHTNFDHYADHYRIGLLQTPIATYLRRVHNLCAATMVPTATQAEQLRRDGYRRVRVLSRGVDDGLFTPARRSAELRASWGVAADAPVFALVGRVAAEKNIELAVRAIDVIRADHPGARLLIVGDGPERARFEGREGVIFAGMRCDEDLAAHYASADCFLFPSMTETYGNVLVEGMASGLACLGFDYAAAAEVVRDGENALTVPFDDEDAFVAAAKRLADDADLRRRLAAAAPTVTAIRSWRAVVTAFESLLLEAIDRPRRARSAA